MAQSSVIEVRGLKETRRKLKRFEVDVRRRIIKSATNFAMTPIVKDAKENTPIGDGRRPDGTSRRHLFETVVKKTKSYRSGTTLTIVGNDERADQTPHAHLVHDGTAPHFIPSGRGGFLKLGDNVVRYGVMHPGADPDAYLFNALKSNSSSAISRFRTKMKRGIAKYTR